MELQIEIRVRNDEAFIFFGRATLTGCIANWSVSYP